MSDQNEVATKSLGLFSTLKAATEIQFFLLAMTFTLLVDSVFTFLDQPGLLELSTSKAALNPANFTLQILLIFVFFSFLTSLALRFLAIFVDELYIHMVGPLIGWIGIHADKKWGGEFQKFNRKYQCVRPYELREEAHRTQDKYYLDLHKEYEDKYSKNIKKTVQHALYSFFCLAMLCANFYIGENNRQTISYAIENHFKSSTPIFLAILGLLMMVFLRFYRNNKEDFIYCPNLYDKLEKKEREAKASLSPNNNHMR